MDHVYFGALWSSQAKCTHPICIMGPSGPTGMPAATHRMHDKNLMMSVLMLKMCRTTVPLRKPISSGIPEDAACGLRNFSKTKMSSSTSQINFTHVLTIQEPLRLIASDVKCSTILELARITFKRRSRETERDKFKQIHVKTNKTSGKLD